MTSHALKVVLFQPQIAPNTGNIGRLCVASGTQLHLVRPFGFVLNDHYLKRSGMDYWPRVKLTIHDDEQAFFQFVGGQQLWFFTSKANRLHWSAKFSPNDWLIFGSETHGLSDSIRSRFPEQLLKIPQIEGERCLNLSSAAAIGLYEALRQVQ